MNADSRPTCPICGNEFPGALEFCPVCMLRQGLDCDVESGTTAALDERFTTEPEQSFEHYELMKDADGRPIELGRGAMGVTYKAIDVDLHCLVALKIIGEKHLGDDAVRLRFLREARAAASVRHPNVASVFHLGRTRSGYLRDGVC